jgi:hypothetical protein
MRQSAPGLEVIRKFDCREHLATTKVSVKVMLRPSVSRPARKVSTAIWSPRPDLYYCTTIEGLLMWGALSDERTSLPFTISAGPRQCSHSRVRVTRDSWPYFTVSDSRLHQPGGLDPRIYMLKEESGPVMLPGTEFLFIASYDS